MLPSAATAGRARVEHGIEVAGSGWWEPPSRGSHCPRLSRPPPAAPRGAAALLSSPPRGCLSLLLPSLATAIPRAEAAQPLAQLDLLYMENKCILASSSEELHEGATA